MSTSQKTSIRGVSLIFALLTLMALSLAALALVRSVDTGALVLGNLGFKQEATASGDLATRQAITYLNSLGDVTNDIGNNGYFASSHDAVDVTGQQQPSNLTRALVNWDVDGCKYAPSSSFGACDLHPSNEIQINDSTTARYVIFRLCPLAGAAGAGNVCVTPPSSTSSVSGGYRHQDYATQKLPGKGSGAYFRIVVRVVGARNTTSFVETIVYR